MAISKRVSDRIIQQVKKYKAILADAKNRDVSESDTVVIVVDMLADILGYRKYTEITTEFSIRGTYVDLAVMVDSEVRFLIEAKAIDVSLKNNHLKQAIDYASNHGVEWVLLTTGAVWQIYKVHFKQPITWSLVYEIDLLQANPKNTQLIECLGNLSREGFTRSSMADYFQQQQATSKFSLASLILSETMIAALRRELRRIAPSIRVEDEFLKAILEQDVLKREVVSGDEAHQAADFIKRSAKATLRAKEKKEQQQPDTTSSAPVTDQLSKAVAAEPMD